MAAAVRSGLVLASIATLVCGVVTAAAGPQPSGAYAWPVQPFHQAHPVRSVFGDPRTLFYGPPTTDVLYHGTGVFSFHPGVDIAAPDGSAVYAVVSGTVTSTAARKVIVRTATGDAFQYWHIVPAVRAGRHVEAYRDVLGRIRASYGHVHLVELRRGHPVNPLAHLVPYADTTVPDIDRIEVRRPGEPAELLPELLRGSVEFVAPISDRPTVPSPGEWATMRTGAAYVSWRIERARDHGVVRTERVVLDARLHVPANARFWDVYARGTRQNDPTFLGHRYWRQDGVFLYRLGVLDTTRLRDGIYSVVVTATDLGGNTATRRQTFLVYNHRLWPPKTDQA